MVRHVKKAVAGVAALIALALGASAIAGAATSQSTTSPSSNPPTNRQAPPAFNGPAPGTAAHENAEKAVTGTAATKAQAAAVKAVGGGTAGPVTTDFTGKGYETTVTKSNGNKVEVHLDSSFNAFAGHGGHPGPPPGGGAPYGQSGQSGQSGPAGPPPGAGYGG